MDMRAGYRQTEIGVIPEDWSLISFSEFMEFRNGVNADKAAYGKGVPFINVLEVITKSHLRLEDIPGRVSLDQSQIATYTVRKGDIVFNRTSETQEEVGLAAVFQGDEVAVFGGFVIRGRPAARLIDPTYAGYGLRMLCIRGQIISKGQGAIRANIGQADLRTILAPLPSLNEQKAIAKPLKDADALIESLEQLIAKKRHLKQGTMQELLRPKEGWSNKKLGSLGVFLKGSGVRKDEAMSGELRCIRYGEIYTKHNEYIKRFHSWISKDVAASAKRLRKGDLLFAGSGETKEEIGKCVAIVDDFEAYAGGDIVILRPENVSPVFMGYYLNTGPINRQKASKGQGDAVVHIGATALAGIDIAIPGLDEQTAIAAILSDTDAEIAALKAKLAKVHQIKQGMMHNLLTGRIRLV